VFRAKDSACLSSKFLRNIVAEPNRRAPETFGIDVKGKSANADAQKKEQDHETIKRISTTDFLPRDYVCDGIFVAS
jgi:hypothetical protein